MKLKEALAFKTDQQDANERSQKIKKTLLFLERLSADSDDSSALPASSPDSFSVESVSDLRPDLSVKKSLTLASERELSPPSAFDSFTNGVLYFYEFQPALGTPEDFLFSLQWLLEAMKASLVRQIYLFGSSSKQPFLIQRHEEFTVTLPRTYLSLRKFLVQQGFAFKAAMEIDGIAIDGELQSQVSFSTTASRIISFFGKDYALHNSHDSIFEIYASSSFPNCCMRSNQVSRVKRIKKVSQSIDSDGRVNETEFTQFQITITGTLLPEAAQYLIDALFADNASAFTVTSEAKEKFLVGAPFANIAKYQRDNANRRCYLYYDSLS